MSGDYTTCSVRANAPASRDVMSCGIGWCGVGDALESLSDAAYAAGNETFGGSLLSALRNIAQVGYLTIYTYSPKNGVRLVAVQASEEDRDFLPICRNYEEKYHIYDPNYIYVKDINGDKAKIIREECSEKADSGFFDQSFFFISRSVEKISIIGSNGQKTIYLNIYRQFEGSRFSTSEVSKISKSAGLILNLVWRHLEMQDSKSSESREAPAILINEGLDRLGVAMTAREKEVLALMLQGIYTEGIASILNVKPTTIITFRKRAYKKLGISTQSELFNLMLKNMVLSGADSRLARAHG